MNSEEGVAEVTALRRIAALAILYGVAAAGLAIYRSGPHAGLALTAGAVVSIFAFRSLEGVVRHLQADANGEMARGGTRRFLFRWVILVVCLVIALILGSQSYLALVIGLSVVPLALITEAGIRIVALGVSRQR